MARPDTVLPYAVVDDHPGVYVCGCFERWVSIYLQSLRGLNLAWTLVSTGRLARGARAAVVGGGFAGLAATAALGRLGVAVTLLERNPDLLATQRHNRVRHIHPHIHEWPRPGAREPRAGLPLLDWSAGLSADVAQVVLAGLDAERARSRIDLVVGARELVLDAPRLSWNGGAPERFDAVLLALGVGIEKSFGALPLRSYWSDDSIATPQPGPPRHHLVTGIGEGGVIDTLYLRLAGFAHAELADRLAEIPGMAAVEAALLALEDEIAGLPDEHANRLLSERSLSVPRAVDHLLAGRARRDNRVTLNGPEAFPLAPRADILNRFLLGRLIALGEVSYRPGKIVDVTADGAVRFEDGGAARFDEIHIRHGTVPALKAGFPSVWERYAPVRARLAHLIPTPQYPDGAFDA